MKKILRNKKKLTAFLSIIIITLTVAMSVINVNAGKTRSVAADWFNATFTKTYLSQRSILVDDAEKKTDIANGGGNASLFDRFGDDIDFVGYLGERKFYVNMLDKVYTIAVTTSQKSGVEALTDVISIISDTKDTGIKNTVYPQRVDIINYDVDPRYVAWKNQTGTAMIIGNHQGHWKVIKYINAYFRFIISGGVEDLLLDTYTDIVTGTVWSKALDMFKNLITVFVIIFVFRLLGMFFKYFKSSSYTPFIRVFAETILAICIIEAFALAPTAFTNFYDKMHTAFQDMINDSISSISIDNAVVSGSEDLVDANLWYITMFDPWCRGMFDGMGYDECEFDSYPLSHEGTAGTMDNPTADAKYIIDNVKVPSASGDANNIAALAYSCQSVYHIDTVYGKRGSKWPDAFILPYSNTVYADDLKWVDAKLNISCQFIEGESNGSLMSIGDNAVRYYSIKGIGGYVLVALLRTIFFLTPLLIASISCIICFAKCIICFGQMVFVSFKFLINPDENYVAKEAKIFLSTVVDYFFSILVKGILISLLITNWDKGLLYMLVYFCVALVFFFGSVSLTRVARELKQRVRRLYNRAVFKVENKLYNKEATEEAKEDNDDSEIDPNTEEKKNHDMDKEGFDEEESNEDDDKDSDGDGVNDDEDADNSSSERGSDNGDDEDD